MGAGIQKYGSEIENEQYVTKMARLVKMYGYNPQRNGADWKVYEYN
jgi:hypothetical protein